MKPRIRWIFGHPVLHHGWLLTLAPILGGFVIPAVWWAHLLMGRQMPVWLSITLLIAVTGALAASLIYTFRSRSRLGKQAKQANFRLCLKCFHSLAGLEGDGRCPECGEPFVAREVEAAWREVLPEA